MYDEGEERDVIRGSDFRRLLIIRFGSLGDVVLSTVVLDGLRKNLPETERWLLTKARYANLFHRDPRLAGVIQWEQDHFLKQVRPIHRMGFDAVLDLHANLRSRALSAVLSPRKLVRYRKQRLTRMRLVHGKRRSVSTRRTVDLYLDALTGLGIREPEGMPRLFVDPAARARVDARMRSEEIGEQGGLIGVHPGARWPSKRWSAEGFARVCDRMIKGGHRIILLGGREDQSSIHGILERMKKQPAVWADMPDLRDVVAAIERCDVLLSNDSGPMHIGTAVGTPVVGLFGPTHPNLGFAPVGKWDVAITVDLPCSPCSLHGRKPCRLPQQRCMEAISPDRVIEALEQVLVRIS